MKFSKLRIKKVSIFDYMFIVNILIVILTTLFSKYYHDYYCKNKNMVFSLNIKENLDLKIFLTI